MKPQIDRDIPIPPRNGNSRLRVAKLKPAVIGQLEPGESVLIKSNSPPNYHFTHYPKRDFTVRRMDKNVFRIWRTA